MLYYRLKRSEYNKVSEFINFISGEVTYSMTPLSAPFYIDTNSGVIRVKASLDRETIDTYSLTVTASDRDPNIADKKSSTVNVTVTLTDVNDNDPVFSPDHYKVTTKEKQLLFSCLNLASSYTLEFSVGRKRCVRLEHSDDVSPACL